MKKQITIKDLAEKLHLHHTTVSRALRDHPDINKETREIVKIAAEKYNYIPNTYAKNLRNASSNLIVVMVPEIRNYFFSEIIGNISELAFRKAYSTLIYQSNEDCKQEALNINVLLKNRVAGVIASVADCGKNSDKFENLVDMGIPVVLFDRFFESGRFPVVRINNRKAGFQAVKLLYKSGKRRIAFFRGKSGNPVFDERFEGYLEGVRRYGLDLDQNLIFEGDIIPETGMQILPELIDDRNNAEALISVVDQVALGCVNECQKLGVGIPGDLAIIGFDNEPAGKLISPGLTTFAQPIEEIAHHVFRILMTKINEGRIPKGDVILDMNLIQRQTI